MGDLKGAKTRARGTSKMSAMQSNGMSAKTSKEKPLFIFYDCEAGNSRVFTADIIEIAAKCDPTVKIASFETLITTKQELSKFTVERCCIKPSDLEGKPTFDVAFTKFLNWLSNLLKRIKKNTGERYFPVLCAHNGYGFDYAILLSNMKRYGIAEHALEKLNLHFADTFQFCKELQEEHNAPELQNTKLSMDSLFSKFCPGKQFLNRHRAMGDVNAMVEIFSQEPFKTAMNKMDLATTKSLCQWYSVQYSEKEQRILLEEKMAKLDAYTRNVYSKKLFQLQLTYDALQAIFENCCSYMDFYEALQDRGIDRKTAKHFASQFGSMGLRNQGTEPYCSLPKSGGLDYSLDNVDLLMVEKETKRPPNVPPLPPADNDVVIECSECWEDELDESRTFTFTIPKPVPALSLTIDDFASPSSFKSPNNAKKKSSSKQNDSGYPKSKPGNKTEIAEGSKRNSKKDELGKARVNDITKTDEVITTESSIHENSGFQKSEAKPNETEASEKSKTNSKKFPRKFLGKTRRNFGNKRDSHPRKNLSASGGQAGTAVAKRNEKENKEMSEDQREKVKRLKGETGDERSKEGTQTAAEITRTTQAVALQEQKNTKTAPENRFGQKDTTVFKKCSIGKKDKQKEKLRRIKQQCEPVIFVNHKSVEKEQRDWRRIEIFVGDFPVQIPVDPSKVDFIEEKFDLNTESKEKDLCGSSVEKQCQENYTCGELPTQPGENEQSLEEGRSDGKVIPSNVDVVIAEGPNESTLFQEQGDRNVDTKKEEAIVGNGLQSDFIPEDSNVASSHEIPKKKRVEMSDSSQQTHSDWCGKEAKKLVDQEQQTDCALLSTFNTETSHVQMQDKETLTDRCRRAQSTDTVSSYGDNLSDSYTTSPSSPLYPCDFDPQYDFNTEELTREYESPLRVFDISMSPHQENRYVGEDIHYPENDTQYLNENSRYHDEDIRYEIPSPKNNEEFSYMHEYQHIPRVYHNPSIDPRALRERFHLRPTAPPPIYPANPDSVPAVPMFHPRFPQPYISHLKYFTSSPPWSSEVLRNNGQCESLRK